MILRLRSALDSIFMHHAGRRVLIVGHQVVVLCLRNLLENMTEKEILDIDAEGNVANCSITEYAFDPDQDASGNRFSFDITSSPTSSARGSP